MRKIYTILAAILCCAMMNAETYGLNVGGVQVTSDNAANIFGNGTASYNATNNRLTLNNADISVDYTANGYKGAIVAAGDLVIVLKGANNRVAVSNLTTYTAAIQTGGRLTIMSDIAPDAFAKLQIVCTNGCALYALNGDVTLLDEVELDIKGASTEYGCIKTMSGDLEINGATLSMLPGWIRVSGTTYIHRSTITAPSDAKLASDGRIVRTGTTSEYSNQQQVVISTNLRRLIYGASPKNKGNKVFLQGNTETQSQATGWVELGDYIHLTATPAEGYTFAGWYDQNGQLLSTNNPYSNQLMTDNTTLIYGQFEEQEQGDTRTIITHVEVNNWNPSFFYDGLEWTGAVKNQLTQMLQVPANAVYYVREVYCRDMSKNQLFDVYHNMVMGPGTYRCEISLGIGGDNGLLYRFPGLDDEVNLTGTINGQTCEVELGGVTDEYSFVYINTPEFVVEAQGIESVQISEVSVQKVIREGQLLIEKNGKTYNALGTEVQ